MSEENTKELSDKALISAYLERRKLGKTHFTKLIEVSKSFLDSNTGISVDSLRKILNHADLKDFNLKAFLARDKENILKDNWQFTDVAIGHLLLVEVASKMAIIENKDQLDPDINSLLHSIRELIKVFIQLSEDYREVYNSRQKLIKAFEIEGKIKGR